MKFIDEVKIHVKAGDGGNGCIAFRREKYVPRGGPDGGDGGHGGSIYLLVDEGKNTLLDFRYQAIFKAKNGAKGMGKGMTGKTGADLVLPIPPGTMVYDAESGELLADLAVAGEKFLLAKGGNGGWGNTRFATSVNRAPRKANPGEEGEEKHIRLELKLLADVGLVGRPNAGKSTLLAAVSAAKPKIADYPFTTLVPQLGVVKLGEGNSFVMADIPGLIEGASNGAGMGIQFLKHIERTKVFLHLIDVQDPEFSDPWKSFLQIEKELLAYNPNFKDRPRIIVLSKIDAISDPKLLKDTEKLFKKKKYPVCAISSVTHEGIEELLQKISELLT